MPSILHSLTHLVFFLSDRNVSTTILINIASFWVVNSHDDVHWGLTLGFESKAQEGLPFPPIIILHYLLAPLFSPYLISPSSWPTLFWSPWLLLCVCSKHHPLTGLSFSAILHSRVFFLPSWPVCFLPLPNISIHCHLFLTFPNTPPRAAPPSHFTP